MRERLDRYLDVLLALASVVVVLLIIVQLTGEVGEPWRGRLEALSWALWGLYFVEFEAKFVLAPVKRHCLSEHWLDVLVMLLPFLRLLWVLRSLRATRTLPVFRLLVFSGKGSSDALVLLRRRRLGQLAAASAMVILIGAAAGFLMESGASGSQIEDFGDALWWSAALATTVGSELYPVTAGERVLGFLLMIYAVGIFSYFIGAIASVLVEADTRQASAKPEDVRSELSEWGLEALRSILKKAEGQ